MKAVVATDISTLMAWWRASLLASPTVLPASTVPWRWIAPVRARIASSSVVLPLWNGPTSAMHRGPVARVPFCAISASLSALRRGLLSSDRAGQLSFQAGGGIGKRRQCGENAPDHHLPTGGADIEPEFADRPGVDFHRARHVGRERAVHRLDRSDDPAPAARHVAGEHAGLDARFGAR